LDRYKLVIQYDGTNFFGWQIQKKRRTIQGLIENTILKMKLSNNRVKIYGSGRTDTGVHAWGQVAHLDLDTKLNNTDFKNAMNSYLPKDCRIVAIEKVNKDFHSRYDARRRSYRYQCYTGESILFRNQSWQLPKLSIDFLNDLSKYIIGNHDFLSFSKYRKELKNTKCTIYQSNWSCNQEMIVFKINANRYLHHMIRYLVGSMVGVYHNRMTKKEFLLLLNKPRKNVKIFKAPPIGLILEKIDYE